MTIKLSFKDAVLLLDVEKFREKKEKRLKKGSKKHGFVERIPCKWLWPGMDAEGDHVADQIRRNIEAWEEENDAAIETQAWIPFYWFVAGGKREVEWTAICPNARSADDVVKIVEKEYASV